MVLACVLSGLLCTTIVVRSSVGWNHPAARPVTDHVVPSVGRVENGRGSGMVPAKSETP